MALDFGNYLLSSSPPGFEYIRLKSFEFSRENDGDFPRCRKKGLDESENAETFGSRICIRSDSSTYNKQVRDEGARKTRWQNFQLMDDRTKVPNRKSEDHGRISDWENTYSCDPENCSCSSKSQKKRNVSFADDHGQVLAEFRVMQEPSNIPPELGPEVLSLFDSSLNLSTDMQSDPAIQLSINFAQPAANYMAFRQKLDKSFVSLENVVARERQVFGTIKVKNLSFNKHVFVRCTFDGWESYSDYPASYSNSRNVCFDTFSFQIDIPSDLSSEKLVQFAICFESEGSQYWDNNDGRNYEISQRLFINSSMENGNNTLMRGPFATDQQNTWSSFSGWAEEHTSPYW